MHPKGVAKMSDALAALVEPYADEATTKKSYSRLLTLGMLAWNAALFPEPKRTAMIDNALGCMVPDDSDGVLYGLRGIVRQLIRRTLGRTIPDDSDRALDELREIVRQLIRRKEAYFADSRRMIVDFELTDTDDGWHILVASTLDHDAVE